MSFLAGSFALAGLVLAATPLLIHLFNRRRFRTVEWAAMDFLREALERQRRFLRLRDVLLLVLRTLCVLLFGLAMARPYFSAGSSGASPDEPVHAVIVIDNSLSMGWSGFERTLLDEAKARATAFAAKLPEGSAVTVIPQSSAAGSFSLDAHRNREDIDEAIDAIALVDRSAPIAAALELAAVACQRFEAIPSKRVVLIGDQQRGNWPAGGLERLLEPLGEVQIVAVGARDRPNAWVEDFGLRGVVADTESPTFFVATLRASEAGVARSVHVELAVGGTTVASRDVELVPGQTREIEFRHVLAAHVVPGTVSYLRATVSIDPDRLPGDDRRHLVVPVVSSLPVVFVDRYGEDEDPAQGRYGDPAHLRRLLAPAEPWGGSAGARGDGRSATMRAHRTTIDALDRELLRDARVVVIAGVENPGPSTFLLQEYVEQGGQLFVAAGGRFDPVLWNDEAWLGGAGVLPAPLDAYMVGVVPGEEAGELEPFFLAFESLVGDDFLIPTESREALADLYAQPVFFKCVVPLTDRDSLEDFVDRQRSRVEAAIGSGAVDTLTSSRAGWLRYRRYGAREHARTVDESVEATLPRVLGRFTNGVPFLVERRIGAGDVVFASTGVLAKWNNLSRTNAVLIWDRLLRRMLARAVRTLDYEAVEEVDIDIDLADRRARFVVERPNGRVEPLAIEASGASSYAVTVRDIRARGHYVVRASEQRAGAVRAALKPALWELPVAINGPAAESDLTAIDADAIATRMEGARYRFVAADAEIATAGDLVLGRSVWKVPMLLVFVLLLAELGVLVRGVRTGVAVRPAGEAAGTAVRKEAS